MNLSILIIDDEKPQVENLQRAIQKKYPNGISVFGASEEKEILSMIENCYYDIAIVDLRMNSYSINGFVVIEKIKEINPYAKVIVVSAYAAEYQEELNKALTLGNILGFVDKSDFMKFSQNVYSLIDNQNETLQSIEDTSIRALKDYYSELKNSKEGYKKGLKFEYFISMLFGQMGFTKVLNRIKDVSSNEVDLAIRNEINDPFFSKFKHYILIECKNWPADGVDRNVFTTFREKVKNTNGLSSLGILITTGYIKKTAYLEALRTSSEPVKIVFLSNPEIELLIFSQNKLETLKQIIDEQIKDN